MKKILYLFLIAVSSISFFLNFNQVFAASTASPKQENVTTTLYKGAPMDLTLHYGADGKVSGVYENNNGSGNDIKLTGFPYDSAVGTSNSADAVRAMQVQVTQDNAAEAKTVQQNTQYTKNNPTDPSLSPVPPCIGTYLKLPVSFSMQGCLVDGSYISLWISARFLWVTAYLFNSTISYSLNLGVLLQSVPIVDIGWMTLRNVANMLFIFVLLYIAINTILQTKSSDTKRLLIRVILVALLLNFSLFLTKVVIDSSNILALNFYEAMSGYTATGTDAKDHGISQAFLTPLGLDSVYNAGSNSNSPTAANGSNAASTALLSQAGPTNTLTPENIIIIGLAGSLLILVTAFVFLAATFLFIIRTIILIIVMILSPLAFVAMILPGLEGKFNEWLKMLLKESFFAPIYLLMVYLVIKMISTGTGVTIPGTKQKGNLASLLTGNASMIGTLYVFIILIGFMIGSLILAKSMGSAGGNAIRGIAGKGLIGGSSWLGRQTAGRAGRMLAKSGWANNLANAGAEGGRFKRIITAPIRGFGKSTRGVGRFAADSSFDSRNAPMGLGSAFSDTGVGKGTGKGGYNQTVKDAAKKYKEKHDKEADLTDDENDKKDEFEKDKEMANAVRADLLLDEKEKDEAKLKELDTEKEMAEQNIVDLTKAKVERIKELDGRELQSRANHSELTEKYNNASDPKVKETLEMKVREAENEIGGVQLEKRRDSLEWDKKIATRQEVINEHGQTVKKIDATKRALNTIDSNYNAKGSNVQNARAEERMRLAVKSNRVQRFKEDKLKGKTAYQIGDYVAEVDRNIADIRSAGNKRGERYLRQSIVSKIFQPGKLITFRDIRKKKNRSKTEEAMDILRDLQKEDKKNKTKEDKNEDKE